MKKVLTLLLAVVLCSMAAKAQMFTSTPQILQESSENVTIYFHADLSGVAGFQNLPSSTPLYAHLGVYTTKSPSTWSHVTTNWNKNEDSYKYEYVSANTYKLTLGNLRSYFGITDENERITTLCVIARSADGKTQTPDQFLTVHEDGYIVALTSDYEGTIITAPTTVKFTAYATAKSKLRILVNDSEIASADNATELVKSYTFNSPAQYVVKAVGTDASGNTSEQSISYLYPNASPQGNYPGGVPKMGAVRNSDGTVTFCLAAPEKSSVIIVPSWDNYETLEKNLMKYQDYQGQRYFWITVSGLDSTTPYPYYYLVDHKYRVGDPYTHLVLDPYNDKYLSKNVFPDRPQYPNKVNNVMLAVYQENIDDYDWQCKNFTIPNHQSLNVYELLFRDFTGTDSKDDGTVREAISKIPYLRDLGINVVELMPIMEFNGNNSWGYNTNFYMAPDKAYGSPDDYKEFIDKCHEAGIAVVLDIVFNQSDGLHPWYMMYPIDSNPFYNKYAPHDFSVLNDWKQENPLVQQQWADAIRYWMTAYNVDGFRFDLVKGLGTSYSGNTGAYNASRVEVMKRLHAVIASVKPDGIHINENLAGDKEENEMGADGQLNWSNLNNNSCQYAMGYASDCSLLYFDPTRCGRTAGTCVSYAESHDEERMGYKQTRYGAEGVKGEAEVSMLRLGSVAAQMLMSPGSKMIWQFGELGADESTKKANGENNTSPKKVLWSYMADNNRRALHQNYAELLCLRLANPELFGNDAKVRYGRFSNALTARWIRLNNGNKEIVVLINPSINETLTVEAEIQTMSGSNYQVASVSKGFNPSPSFGSGTVSCQVSANSYVVLTTTNVASGVEEVVADFGPKASVYVDGGRIFVAGEYSRAAVYSLSGMQYGLGRELPRGVYIVNVDGHATKIAVR